LPWLILNRRPAAGPTAADLSDSTLRFYQTVRFRAAAKRCSSKRPSTVGEELHGAKRKVRRSTRRRIA
jgi:hypothetical protein